MPDKHSYYYTFGSKVTFVNLEATRNELTQTKTTVEELSAKLKGKLANSQRIAQGC